MIAKTAVTMALPTIMSSTGVVVYGVGTIQSTLTAVAASFAAAPVAVPVYIAGAVVAVGNLLSSQ